VKLKGARLASFLRQPDPAIRAALFFGPDAGLVRERAEAAAKAVCPDLKDPFRVAELAASAIQQDPARLADEAASLSLMGGRRVVRVRDAGDGAARHFEALFASDRWDAFVVVEAGDLPYRSTLRKLFEGDERRAVAVECELDGPAELAELIRATLAAEEIKVEREALDYLVDRLGGDRLMTRAELEKLALYAGRGGRVGLAEATACVGDAAALTLQDAIFAAADGDAAELDRALSRAFQEGENPVGVVRAAIRHFQRLHLAAARVATGAAPAEAVKALRPPVFWKLQERFAAQLRRWPTPRAAEALTRLTQAEIDCKRTGVPDEAVCRGALLALAQAASRGDGGASGSAARR
jgi:DNA polymerase-3 subunit delta